MLDHCIFFSVTSCPSVASFGLSFSISFKTSHVFPLHIHCHTVVPSTPSCAASILSTKRPIYNYLFSYFFPLNCENFGRQSLWINHLCVSSALYSVWSKCFLDEIKKNEYKTSFPQLERLSVSEGRLGFEKVLFKTLKLDTPVLFLSTLGLNKIVPIWVFSIFSQNILGN